MDETFLIKLLARLDTYIHIACYAAVYTAACLLKDPYNNNNSSCSCRRWIPADTHIQKGRPPQDFALGGTSHPQKHPENKKKKKKKGPINKTSGSFLLLLLLTDVSRCVYYLFI